jgi:hypothetical protein
MMTSNERRPPRITPLDLKARDVEEKEAGMRVLPARCVRQSARPLCDSLISSEKRLAALSLSRHVVSRSGLQESRAMGRPFKGTIHDVADDVHVDMERELAAALAATEHMRRWWR